jgi:RNA polymerase sigma factor (sigma-70 family)
MPPLVPEQLSRTIETLYRSESGRVLATLVRLLGDLDLAEEAMHEAFAAALESWPQTGIPDKPRPWLISTARFKAIDGMRRRARSDGKRRDFALYTEAHINETSLGGDEDDEEIEDDRLRLIFTCCHPALPPEGQVALTLREICGLTTEEIARAFLVTPAILVCLGYLEPGKFEGMTEGERNATFDECFEYNDHLRANGHLVGISILEARDLNHAIQLVSELPGFKYGLGPIEIRPATDLNEMLKASEQRRRQHTAR